MIDILCKPMYKDSITPTQAYEDDAGWDLYAHSMGPDYSFGDRYLYPNETLVIHTGVALAIPKGHIGLIFDRSSVGMRDMFRLMGVIDPGYRGEIDVKLASIAKQSILISKGMKIAQIIVIEKPKQRMMVTSELPPSERGEKGFGSSGS